MSFIQIDDKEFTFTNKSEEPMADDLNTKLFGNIDSSEVPIKKRISNRLMSLNVSNVQVRDWLFRQRESIRPWSEFVDSKRFSKPGGMATAGKRIIRNVERFQSNYLFVFIGLLIFCLLTSPILLLAMGACLGACYIISIKNADRKIIIMGHELTLAQQYAGVGIISFPIFWLSGAGSAVFWVIGSSILVIVLHATFYMGIDEMNDFELPTQPV